jgi:peptidoglycan/xylan/chitin deacetylase (PgdA/CDA1 family)
MKLIKRIFRRIDSYLRPSRESESGGVILLYHRVIDLASDPQLLCVKPSNFEAQMRLLRESNWQPISLDEMLRKAAAGEALKQHIAVTFDDGCADNLYFAKPILERYEIPATVFVVSGQVNRRNEFWWDELGGILLDTPDLPDELTLSLHGEIRTWSTQADVRDNPAWHVLQEKNLSPRQQVYMELARHLRNSDAAARETILSQLRQWAGLAPLQRVNYRAMTDTELRTLADGGLVTIGAHTVTHSMLSILSPAEQAQEIKNSRQHLEAMLGQPVNSFSYPFGSRDAFNQHSIAAAQQANFDYACANWEGVVNRHTAPFKLPRFIVRDWNAETFAVHLTKWGEVKS